ncbi:MAG: hypothetical protein KAT05_13700 [Spirochaetes bacterium]|nr:hypothetical protein [Spirochaetota bacterium]
MDINTGKLASSSSLFLKKIKDNDTSKKISNINNEKEKALTKRLQVDFADIKSNDKIFKNRFINLNNQLSKHENELSKTQFIDQNLGVIENLLQQGDTKQITQIIENSIFGNEKILKRFFSSIDNFSLELQKAKQVINNKYSQLDNNFKAIEITSQNIISLYSHSMQVSDNSIKDINLDELVKSTKVNHKRVMDLVS